MQGFSLFFQAIASYKDGIAQGIGYLAQQWADLADGEADEVTKARRAAEAKNALFGENLAKVVVVASKADDERFFAAAQKRRTRTENVDNYPCAQSLT